jgi:hypothetical protein
MTSFLALAAAEIIGNVDDDDVDVDDDVDDVHLFRTRYDVLTTLQVVVA